MSHLRVSNHQFSVELLQFTLKLFLKLDNLSIEHINVFSIVLLQSLDPVQVRLGHIDLGLKLF